jgi:hypothetical protein
LFWREGDSMVDSNKVVAQAEAKKMLIDLLGGETLSENLIDNYNWLAYRIRLYL